MGYQHFQKEGAMKNGMLVFTLCPGESYFVGDAKITVLEIRGQKVRVGTDAPRTVPVDREKIRRNKEEGTPPPTKPVRPN